MKQNMNILPDTLREIVYSNDEIVPDDIQQIRNRQIIRFYSLMINDAESEKEVWDILSCFMKIHKNNLDELSEIIELAYNKISAFQDV